MFEQDAGAADGVAAELVVASKFQFIEAAMTTKHSEAFIEQALIKAFSRGGRTIKTVAEDLTSITIR